MKWPGNSSLFMHISAEPKIVPTIQQVLNPELVNDCLWLRTAWATKLERRQNMQAQPTTE